MITMFLFSDALGKSLENLLKLHSNVLVNTNLFQTGTSNYGPIGNLRFRLLSVLKCISFLVITRFAFKHEVL